MRWPLDKFVTTQGFHAGHTANDIAAPSGTTIKAPENGKVTQVNNNATGYFGGKYIKMVGSSGYVYYMGHNSSNSVSVGQTVKEGQAIGKVGQTGQATGPHIHFEMVGANGAVDPSKVIKKTPPKKEEKEVLELQPPVFNARYYLNNNPDVNKHYNTLNAKNHWLESGIKEGRNSAPNFHVKEYLANYGDLQRVYGKTGYAKAVKHYFNHGINEGRSGRTIQPSQDSKFKILADKVKALVPFTK